MNLVLEAHEKSHMHTQISVRKHMWVRCVGVCFFGSIHCICDAKKLENKKYGTNDTQCSRKIFVPVHHTNSFNWAHFEKHRNEWWNSEMPVKMNIAFICCTATELMCDDNIDETCEHSDGAKNSKRSEKIRWKVLDGALVFVFNRMSLFSLFVFAWNETFHF